MDRKSNQQKAEVDNIEKLYYDKIRIYNVFKPSYYYGGGLKFIEYDLGMLKEYNVKEKYDMSVKFYIGVKPGFESIQDGYMCSFKKLAEVDVDDCDREFIRAMQTGVLPMNFEKVQFVGLHDYGKRQASFEPSLRDVISYLREIVPSKGLAGINRIYVTTRPYPSGDFGECYDIKKDKHRGLTVCYINQI